MTILKLKRAYEPSSEDDGYRVFIDRLWPRGFSHETFKYDEWVKDLAPSNDLRHWFHENQDTRWQEFEERYKTELLNNPGWPEFIESISRHPVVTLIYSSHNETENNAIVVESLLVKTYPKKFQNS